MTSMPFSGPLSAAGELGLALLQESLVADLVILGGEAVKAFVKLFGAQGSGIR